MSGRNQKKFRDSCVALYGVPEAEYHSWPHLSSSKLQDMRLSPRNFWMKHLNPERIPVPPSDAMEEGTLSHMMLLEPHRFADRYLPTNLDRRGTKKWEEESEDAAERGKELMKSKEWLRYHRMAKVLQENDLVRKCVGGAKTEVSITWKMTGKMILDIPAKARIDILQDWGIVDVKTSRDPENFEKSCVSYGYHRQAAFYRRAVCALTGEMRPFSFLVFSTEYPFTVRVFSASEEFLAAGEDEIDQLIQQYEVCVKTDTWEDKCGPFILNLPRWYGRSCEE